MEFLKSLAEINLISLYNVRKLTFNDIMRLTQEEVSYIKDAIHQVDPLAKIYLFGSRVYDHKKGGDIDLLIFSEKLTFLDKAKIKSLIFEKMEEQRIDITIAKDDSDPFVQIALEEGILL